MPIRWRSRPVRPCRAFQSGCRRIDLKGSVADISGIELEKGTVRLSIGEGPPDTSATAEGKPVAWKIRVSKLALDDIAFSMETKPHITELDVLLKQGNLADCLVDLSRQQVAVTEIVLDGGSYSFLTDTTKIAAGAGHRPARPRQIRLRNRGRSRWIGCGYPTMP